MAFNFKFSKTKAPSKLLPRPNLIAEKEEKSETKAELVTSIEDNQVKTTTPVEEKTPLVIPLIQNNVWRGCRKRTNQEIDKDAKEGNSKSNSLATAASTIRLDQKEVTSTSESLDEKAKRELLLEAKAFTEKEVGTDSKRVIPILLANKVPEGFEEEGNFDVSIRPDAPKPDDYERVPVGEFGWAMLRGMGFDEKKAKSVTPIEVKIRPKGLGLGADGPPEKKIVKEEKK